MLRPFHPIESYNIGIICALSIERAAARAILDEEHRNLGKPAGDDNSYTVTKSPYAMKYPPNISARDALL